ncbi:hypothetical protein [Motilibacter deserti]|uniref:Uncharacterized protein n=1 Tax=Motilibacter deserti TaxID=2714956 RepID=A0ABX0GT29_9ACTN|nr:hypothetical protein [Motilibacter deserti]NHC12900.1 hypothetical protein [Motilibacter deserti]
MERQAPAANSGVYVGGDFTNSGNAAVGHGASVNVGADPGTEAALARTRELARLVAAPEYDRYPGALAARSQLGRLLETLDDDPRSPEVTTLASMVSGNLSEVAGVSDALAAMREAFGRLAG